MSQINTPTTRPAARDLNAALVTAELGICELLKARGTLEALLLEQGFPVWHEGDEWPADAPELAQAVDHLLRCVESIYAATRPDVIAKLAAELDNIDARIAADLANGLDHIDARVAELDLDADMSQ